MKLTSVHFAQMLPIPGTSRRESSLHAAEGWDLDRADDGRITCARTEPVEGGTALRRFVVEGWPCVWEEVPEPVALVEPETIDASLATAPTEPPAGKRRRR